MREHDRIFIAGAWVRPKGGAGTIEVGNPATEETIGRVPDCGPADVARAVAAARAALPGWSALAPAERGTRLSRAADLLAEQAETMALTITAEVGTPLKLSRRIQVGLPLAAWKRYAALAAGPKPAEEIGNSTLQRVPVGVVGCITPWNYPLHQITAKVAAALAAGCTVVLKPSELAPLNAFLLAEALEAADLPAGVFNLVSGAGMTGAALAANPGVELISFTGSTATGRAIAEAAARRLARVSLELGGKSASVVLEGADLARAVKSTVSSCFLNSGQTCSALTRLIVPESRYEEAREIARAAAQGFQPGDPTAETTRLGPLISARQRERVLTHIRGAIESGAELIQGGPDNDPDGPGHYLAPTVFGRVDPASALAQEEVFGPVLAILTYRGEAEALAIANGTGYGLAGAVWAATDTEAAVFARGMRAGQVDLNGAPFNLDAPFGGFGLSGYGRENGRFGIEEFQDVKAIQRSVANSSGF